MRSLSPCLLSPDEEEPFKPLFTRDELLRCNCWPGPGDDPPPMLVAEFDWHHYRVPVQGRQAAHRGDKDHFLSPLDFWVWSEFLIDNPRTPRASLQLAEQVLCAPMNEQSWIESLSYALWQLKRPAPVFLTRTEGFIGAMRIYQGFVLDQVRSSVLAEFDDCFVAWHQRIVP